MAKLERFEDIEAWRKARDLTKAIYQVTAGGEFARDFGLRDQIRRAAVSILSNIAEGFERSTDKELFHFLSIAKGSCGEVRAQLYVAFDQTYVDETQFQRLSVQAVEVSRLLSGFMKYLNASGRQKVKAARSQA